MVYVIECSMFSSKSFIVFGLTFRPLIHFEFIFVYDVRKCSSFILLHVASCSVFHDLSPSINTSKMLMIKINVACYVI